MPKLAGSGERRDQAAVRRPRPIGGALFGHLGDKIGRRETLIVAATLGWAPMIAVQGAFYAELFGARVRYTGFATSRELGAAVAGFSPLVSAALVGAAGGEPWLVAAFFVGLSVISLVAFLFSVETRDVDITELDPAQREIVTTAAVTEAPRAIRPQSVLRRQRAGFR